MPEGSPCPLLLAAPAYAGVGVGRVWEGEDSSSLSCRWIAASREMGDGMSGLPCLLDDTILQNSLHCFLEQKQHVSANSGS